MDYKNPEALVTTDWLAKNIAAPNLSIIDASFFLPAAHRDAKKEFNNCHIPGAVFLILMKLRIRVPTFHTCYRPKTSFHTM